MMGDTIRHHYRAARARGYAAKTALDIARRRAAIDALAWDDAPATFDGWRGELTSWVTWDGPQNMTVRLGLTETDFEHCDATEADGWPLRDRAQWYHRHYGMARGVAWQHAQETWGKDKERENDWRSANLVIVVDLPNGARGMAHLGHVDYLATDSWEDVWSDMIDTAIGEGMVNEATRDAVANVLPPMLQAMS